MPLTLEETKSLIAALGVKIPDAVLEGKAQAEEFAARREKVLAEAGKKPADWGLKQSFDDLLKRAVELVGKQQFDPALKCLEEAEQLLRQTEAEIQIATRRQQAKILRQAAAAYPVPAAWAGSEADSARQILQSLGPLLADETPTQEQLDAASDFYDQLPAAVEAARAKATSQGRLLETRERLRTALDEMEQRLARLPAKTAQALRNKRAGIRSISLDASAGLEALEAAESSLADLDGQVIAASLEVEKRRAEFKTELTKLKVDGKALDPAEAEAIAQSFDPDELADLKGSVGLESLAKLNRAFRAPDAPQSDQKGLSQLKALINDGLGGGANLKALLTTGCDNDPAKLAAFGKAFSTGDDLKRLGQLMGVGKKDGEKTGKLQGETVAVLLKNGCGGRVEAFKGLATALAGDSPEAEAGREQMRNLLEEGGLARAPEVLGGLIPPASPGSAPDQPGKDCARVLKNVATAFEGESGAKRFNVLLNSGFVPDKSKPASDRVSAACLGDLLREGCDGDAKKLSGLASQLDVTQKVATLDDEIKELRKKQQSFEQQRDKLDEEADGLTGKQNKNRRDKKREQAATADKKAKEFAAELAAKQKERDTLAASPQQFKDLLVEGGLGKHSSVLAQTFKTGCAADAGKLVAVGSAFSVKGDRDSLKAMIENGGLGRGTGERPDLLGDMLKNGLQGDPEKLKDMAVAFNPATGSRMSQLKEITGVFGNPPHGPPPDGPGKQIDALLAPKHLNGDVKKLQTKFAAKMAEIPDTAKRKKAIEWTPRYKKEAVPATISDNAPTSGTARAASGKQTFRHEHCLKRHRADTFDFSDIKTDNTQWPPNTANADIQTYMNATLEQFATAPQAVIDPTQKVMLVNLAGGKKVAVQIAWNGTRITQFFPLAFAQAQGRFPALTAAEYLPDVVNFRQAEMEKIRDALSP